MGVEVEVGVEGVNDIGNTVNDHGDGLTGLQREHQGKWKQPPQSQPPPSPIHAYIDSVPPLVNLVSPTPTPSGLPPIASTYPHRVLVNLESCLNHPLACNER